MRRPTPANVFATDPVTDVLAPSPQSAPQQDPKTALTDLARTTQVPINILMAEVERAGVLDMNAVGLRAAQWQSKIAERGSIEDAANDLYATEGEGFLKRAVEIDRELFGDADAPEGTVNLGKHQPGMLGDAARSIGGAAVRFGAAAPKAAGIAADYLIDVATLNDPAADTAIEQARAEAEGRAVNPDNLGQATTFFTRAADIATTPLRNMAEAIENTRSDATIDDVGRTTLEGEILKPWTWETSEDATLNGLFHKGIATIGDLFPVIATAVITKNAGATAAVGAAATGGQAAMEARDIVEGAYRDVDENGVSRLETESQTFRDMVERGMTKDQAAEALAMRSEQVAGQVGIAIGSVGGALTQKLVAPAAGSALGQSLAGRTALGALEEGTQEAIEGTAVRAVTNEQAGLDQSLGEGTLEEFVIGGMAGGAAAGALGGQRQEPDQLDGPDAQLMLPAPEEVDPATGEPVGAMQAAMDSAAPSLAPDIAAGADVVITTENGDVQATYVGETVEGVIVDIDGKQEVVPREELAAGLSSIAEGVIQPLPPEDDVDTEEERRRLQGRIQQLNSNAQAQGWTPRMIEMRDQARQALGLLPVPPLPIGHVPVDDNGSSLTVTMDAEPDFDTIWPAPDADRYETAAEQGTVVPTTPQAVVETLQTALGVATDLTTDLLAAKEGSPAHKRATQQLGQVWAELGILWDEPTIDIMEQQVLEYANRLTGAAEPITDVTSNLNSKSEIEDAVGDALDEADAAEAGDVAPDATDTQPERLLSVENIRAKAAVLRGLGEDTPPTVGNVSFKWDAKEGGWIFARKHADAVREAMNLGQTAPDETAATEAAPENDSPDTVAVDPENTPNPNPTEAQKEAGNYKKGRFTWNGRNLVVETAKGQERSGKGEDGKPWSVTMPHDYGDIKGTTGADGDPVDFYMGPNRDSKFVYVVNQHDDRTGKFDEHKVLLGFDRSLEAREAYIAGFSDGKGENRIGGFHSLSMEQFNRWLDKGDLTQPYRPQHEDRDGSLKDNPPTVHLQDNATASKLLKEAGFTQLDIEGDAIVERMSWVRPYPHKYMEGQVKIAISSRMSGWVLSDGAILGSDPDVRKMIAQADAEYPMLTPENSISVHAKDNDGDAPKNDKPKDDAKADTKPQEDKPKVKPKGEKIDDFGEKIGDARKDRAGRAAASLGEDMDVVSMPMAQAFPIPDYEALAASGVPQDALAAVAAIRGSMPRKTRQKWRWRSQWEGSRALAARILGADPKSEAWTESEVRQQAVNNSAFSNDAATYDVFKLLPASMLKEASAAYTARGYTNDKTSGSYRKGEWTSIDLIQNKPKRRLRGFTTPEEAALRIMELIAEKREAAKASDGTGARGGRKPVNLSVDKVLGTGQSAIFMNIAGRVQLSQSFDTVGEARDYLKNNEAELQKRADDVRDGLQERTLENRERKGPEHRKGDVTPKDFTKAFGFRGVEFGNWNNQAERQASLNRAYDALFDLAGVLDVPTKTLSLDGQLALAFGARGTGGRNPAAAHYETGKTVINLTKKNGAGSLAHEWWHAVDNHFARKDAEMGGKPAVQTAKGKTRHEFLTDRAGRNGSGSASAINGAVYELRRAMTAAAENPWLDRSKEADKGRKVPYFATNIELAARSFEKFVKDRLTERGMVNDYLANIYQAGGAYPSTREMQTLGLTKAWSDVTAATQASLDVKGDKGPKLPDADASRLYTGPDAGEVWRSVDGKNKIETRTDDTITATMADGSTEVFTVDEATKRIEEDLAAYRAKVEGRQNNISDERKAKRKEVTRHSDAARDLIARFEKDAGRKPGAVQSALSKSYRWEQGIIDRGTMMVHLIKDKGWRVTGEGRTRNLKPTDNTGFFGADSWTKASLDFAQWYVDLLELEADTKGPASDREAIEEAVDAALDAEEKTAGQAAKSAAKNAGNALGEAAAGLFELFGGKDQLNSGLTFNKETYAKAKPHFDAAMRALGNAGSDVVDMAKALVSYLTSQGMGSEARKNMKPYLVEYIADVQKGAHDPFKGSEDAAQNTDGDSRTDDSGNTGVARDGKDRNDDALDAGAVSTATNGADGYPDNAGVVSGGAPETAQAVAETYRPVVDAALQSFRDGDGFRTIQQARKLAATALGRTVETSEHKAIEEAIEQAVARRAREIVYDSASRPETLYLALTDLYNSQPLLAQRSSSSAAYQAYSTPAPLAYLVGRLAGIRDAHRVVDPAAGMGMLTIAANPANVVVNEIQTARVAALQDLMPEARVSQQDAMTADLGKHDVLVLNPPFGTVKENEQTKVYPMGSRTTREIDHAMAWRYLEAMPDDGSAVLLLGGVRSTLSGEDRKKGYQTGSKRAFYKALYEQYNVVEHFTVNGDLYKRQGAAWPVDVVVIRGKGASDNDLPMKTAPTVYNTWEELGERLNVADSLGAAESNTVGSRDDGPDVGQIDPDVDQFFNAADREAGQVDRDGGPDGAGATDTDTNADVAAGQRDGQGNLNLGADRPAGGIGSRPDAVSRDADAKGSQRGRASVAGRDGNADGLPASSSARVDRAANEETETEFQVQYEPRSKAKYAVGTLVPVAMQQSASKALDAIEAEHGDIDAYVADALGYTTDELLGTADKSGYFSAEQVDALAMAINEVSRGKGFIIGDQTGVGKGRFVAAMLRYAKKLDRVPVFITKDPGLYSDMIRDMRAIGEADAHTRILMTNTNVRGKDALPLSGDPKDTLEGLSPAATAKALEQVAKTGVLPDGVDYLFTTYSQMDTVNGKEPARRNALRAIAKNGMFVLDESHLAGGAATTGYTKKDAPPNRAKFARELMDKAQGTVFSSATYAKNPYVMSLYATTDLSLAVSEGGDLSEAIAVGGVPLQQVVASMLTEAGQYARRERSWDGIDFAAPTADIDVELATNTTALIAEIFDADRMILSAAREEALKTYKEAGFMQTPDGAVGVASIQNSNFASIVHNVVSQMLLALKVDAVAKRAAELHKKGEKPIIAVVNTNGALLDDVIEDQDIKFGQAADVPFKVIMRRYVERLRNVTIREDAGQKEPTRVTLTDAQLGPAAAMELKRLHKAIDDADLGSLSGAPLDRLQDLLRDAGVKVGEITGRTKTIDKGKLKARDASNAAKKRTMLAYNKGDLDALVINQAGSTGYSMHATADADNDGKQRTMLILQPDPNIDVFMQMLGRINRTGQILPPKYEIVSSNLAVEKRVSAVLMAKMASLNANTTASADSAVSLDNVTDFLNIVGDDVVKRYLNENPDLRLRLDVDPDSGTVATKLTGRLAILPPDEAAKVYYEIESAYNDEIAELDKIGENPLRAVVYDWQAEVIDTATIATAQKSKSPFARDTVVEYLSVRKLSKPMTWDEVQGALKDRMDGRSADAVVNQAIAHVQSAAETMSELDTARVLDREKALANLDDSATDGKRARATDALKLAQDKRHENKVKVAGIVERMKYYTPGKPIRLNTPMGMMYGTVLEIDAHRITDNPLALSKVRVRFALADAAREITIPLSRIGEKDAVFQVERSSQRIIEAAFTMGESNSREVRAVATGNLIDAFAQFRSGQIAFYTDAEGNQKSGVVMPRGFDVKQAMEDRPVYLRTPEHVTTFLRRPARVVHTEDGILTVQSEANGSYTAIAKAGNRDLYTDPKVAAITGEWSGRGNAAKKVNFFGADVLRNLLDLYTRKKVFPLVTDGHKETARAITGESLPDIEVPKAAKLKRRNTPSTKRQGKAILRAALTSRLQRAGLSETVTLKIAKQLFSNGAAIDGYQLGRVIGIAMDADSATAALDHEILHAMRDAKIWGVEGGLIGESDWRTLVRAVRRDPARLKAATEAYPDLTSREQMEEAVADMFADYRAGRDVMQAKGVFGRIMAALDGLVATMRGAGYKSATDVMGAIADGTLGQRVPIDPETDPDDTPPSGAKLRRRKTKDDGSDSTAALAAERAIDAAYDLAQRAGRLRSKAGRRAFVSDAMDQGQSGMSILALVPGRPLLLELAKNIPAANTYQLLKERMDAMRNAWAAKTDTVAKAWQWQAFKNSKANKAFMQLMHEATLAGIDPQDLKYDADLIDHLAQQNVGDDADAQRVERARLKMLRQELIGRYQKLPEPFQKLWGDVRDLYGELADDWDAAIIANHEKAVERSIKRMRKKHASDSADLQQGVLSKAEKKKAQARLDAELQEAITKAENGVKQRVMELRAVFEGNRIEKPYFPLARFGNYFVTLKDETGKVVSFSKFEKEIEQTEFAAEMEGKYEVITGVMGDKSSRLDKSVDPAFVAAVADILETNGADKHVMDEVWQHYLATMPDMSLRTSRIHRKGREGFTNDALRAFASHMFHGAHQLARLKHEIDMSDALDDMADQAKDADDPNRAQHVINEIEKRHDFTMSPRNAGWTAAASSLAFVMYLGLSPAAALVNISQTTVIGIPMMKAKLKSASVGDITAALAKASRDYVDGGLGMDKSKRLTANEAEAMAVAAERSLTVKTQAHDTAGLAETGIDYSPVRARVMEVIGGLFHHAELFNREATFLATYRLAIKEGVPHKSAIDRAAQITWDVHFDYQNNSRPRFMQADFPKVLLTFRNYNVNMLYRLVRDTHQATKGDTPEARKEARTQLIGITGSMALHAGITGTWGYNLVMMILGLFFYGGETDEAEEDLKKLLIGAEDPQTGLGHMRRFVGAMALNGVPGHLLKTDLSERIGMPSLWFRKPYQSLDDGGDLYQHLLTQAVGPVPALAEKGLRGIYSIAGGEVGRGIEDLAPTGIRSLMRAKRYLSDGLETRNGDTIIEDISPYEAFIQALGFTPAQVSERYDINNAMKRAERNIENKRRDTLRTMRKAVAENGGITEAARQAIIDFNRQYPEWPINRQTIRRSLRAEARARASSTQGIILNDKIEDRVRGSTAPSIYS